MTARVARAIQKRRRDRRSGNVFPQKRFLLWYTAQPWANAQKVSAEKMRTTERAYQYSSARNVFVVWVFLSVFANVRALRTFVLLLKGETLELKSRAKKGRFVFGRFLSLESLLFLQRFCLPGGERERERESWLRALIKEKKRGAEVDRSRTERESERRYDTY
jgi:hypothetical protein